MQRSNTKVGGGFATFPSQHHGIPYGGMGQQQQQQQQQQKKQHHCQHHFIGQTQFYPEQEDRRTSFMAAEREGAFPSNNQYGGQVAGPAQSQQSYGSSAFANALSSQIDNIKRNYEDRLMSMSEELTLLIQNLPNDTVIGELVGDDTSSEHVQERIMEIIKSALDADREREISRLANQLSVQAFEDMERSRSLEETKQRLNVMHYSLQQETAQRQSAESKIAKLREKFQELGGKHVETKAQQTRAKKDAKKYSSKVTSLSDRVNDLEEELEQMDDELQKARRQLLDHDHIKDELKQTVKERDNLAHEMDQKNGKVSSLQKEQKDMRLRLEKLSDDLGKSESERLDLRKMYLSISEKIMAAMKSGDFYNSFENMFDILFGNEGLVMESVMKTEDALHSGIESTDVGSMYFLKQKLRDLKQRFYDEMRENKVIQKQQKKRIKELESVDSEKQAELHDASSLLTKCQNKIEKYRSRYEEEVKFRQKLESNFKRTVGELEYSLNRVKKNYEELQEDFNRRVVSKTEDLEKRLRDNCETQIAALKREIADKDTQLQKITMEKMMQAQLSQMVKQTRQPEQLERMIDVYENKIASYQRDFLSKAEHEQRLREQDQKLQNEQRNIVARMEFDTQEKLRQIEDTKNKEFNVTLTNIKQAIKQLESQLEEEKKKNRHVSDKLESELKINDALKEAVSDLEAQKRELVSHIDDASDGVNQLKEAIESESTRRREAQESLAREQSEIKRYERRLEEMRSKRDALIKLVEEHKDAIVNLKRQLEQENRSFENISQESVTLTTNNRQLEKEKRKMLEAIQSVIHYVQYATKSSDVDDVLNASNLSILQGGVRTSNDFANDVETSEFALDELCRELNRSVMQMREGHERIVADLDHELNGERRQSENAKWQKNHYMHKMEIVLREKIALLKKELGQVRSAAEREVLTMRHAMEKYMGQLEQHAYEYNAKTSETIYEIQRNLDGENSLMKSQFQSDLREQQNELQRNRTESQQRIMELETRLRTVLQEKNTVERDLTVHETKFNHLKDIIRVLNAYVPLSTEVQTGLLSNQEELVSTAMQELRNALEDGSHELEERSKLLHGWEERFSRTHQDLESQKSDNQSLQEELKMARKQNLEISQTQKQNTDAYQNELRSLYGQLETLQLKYRDEVNKQSQLKDSGVRDLKKVYEQKLEELQKKIEAETKRFSDMNRDRKKLQAELEKIRNQLDSSLQEIENKKNTIRELSSQNQRELESNNQELQELRKKLTEKEERLRQEELSKQRYREKTNRKQQAISELQNLLENTVRATSATDTSIFSTTTGTETLNTSQRRTSSMLESTDTTV